MFRLDVGYLVGLMNFASVVVLVVSVVFGIAIRQDFCWFGFRSNFFV